jgi:multiple sugar transport system permease protein
MGYAAGMAWVLLVAIAVFTALAFGSARYWVFYQDRAG